MKEVSHRWFKCSCGYENDRDVIAVVNLNERGVSDPLDCPSNEGCKPEPMRGTLALQRRGGSQIVPANVEITVNGSKTEKLIVKINYTLIRRLVGVGNISDPNSNLGEEKEVVKPSCLDREIPYV